MKRCCLCAGAACHCCSCAACCWGLHRNPRQSRYRTPHNLVLQTGGWQLLQIGGFLGLTGASEGVRWDGRAAAVLLLHCQTVHAGTDGHHLAPAAWQQQPFHRCPCALAVADSWGPCWGCCTRARWHLVVLAADRGAAGAVGSRCLSMTAAGVPLCSCCAAVHMARECTAGPRSCCCLVGALLAVVHVCLCAPQTRVEHHRHLQCNTGQPHT